MEKKINNSEIIIYGNCNTVDCITDIKGCNLQMTNMEARH